MAQQDLDGADVRACLEQVSGKAVAQDVRCYPLVQSTAFGGPVERSADSFSRNRLIGTAAWKEIGTAGLDLLVIGPQHSQQLWTKHGITAISALALAHVDERM